MKRTDKLLAPQAIADPASLLESVVEQSGNKPQVSGKAQGIAIGRLLGFDPQGRPLVDVPPLSLVAQVASSLVQLDETQIGQAIALGFESGEPQRPIILGAMLSAPLASLPAAPAEMPDVVVDGQRVVLEAEREIELRCGDAAIVLTADGRITLRGTYITSHASATQRILGGSVNVN